MRELLNNLEHLTLRHKNQMVFHDFSSFYQEPIVEEEQYEEIGDDNIYEYDDRMRALENEKYEG